LQTANQTLDCFLYHHNIFFVFIEKQHFVNAVKELIQIDEILLTTSVS
jgi:hypothetical protein